MGERPLIRADRAEDAAAILALPLRAWAPVFPAMRRAVPAYA